MDSYQFQLIWISAGLIIASTIGALVGAIVLYLLGKLISFEKFERLITGKWGKILHFKMEHLEKAQRFFERHGSSTAFWGRFLPVVRSLISVPAGMAKFPIKRFLIFTAGGSLIWNAVLIVVGRLAGASWERFSVLIEKYSFVLLARCNSDRRKRIFDLSHKNEKEHENDNIRKENLLVNWSHFLLYFRELLELSYSVIPQIPFLIIAFFCLSKGAPKVHHWIRTPEFLSEIRFKVWT